MPKPKLPDEQRKDVLLQVRFLESEMKTIVNQAKKRNCKTISQYIRQLIAEDVKFEGFADFGIPQLQRRK
jgi:hypothetical protein